MTWVLQTIECTTDTSLQRARKVPVCRRTPVAFISPATTWSISCQAVTWAALFDLIALSTSSFQKANLHFNLLSSCMSSTSVFLKRTEAIHKLRRQRTELSGNLDYCWLRIGWAWKLCCNYLRLYFPGWKEFLFTKATKKLAIPFRKRWNKEQ